MSPNPNEKTPASEAVAVTKPSFKQRMEAFIAEYGAIALVVHYSIFFLSVGVFALLIRSGFQVDGAAGTASTWGGAYVAAQVIKLPRFAATFALTPLVARVWRRLRKSDPSGPSGPDERPA